MIPYEKRQKIATQALAEISFARQAKLPKIDGWHKNEDLYYNKKINMEVGKINVNLNEMKSFVDTFISKINSPWNFTYVRGEEADLQKAKIANAIKDKDRKGGDWDAKALFADQQLVMYGRYIFEYHADSVDNNYCSHLTNVDVYQFLIDPSCGGLDIEKAFYLWRGGILKTKKQLKDWVKDGRYLKTEVEELTNGSGNASDVTQEDMQAKNRYIGIISAEKTIQTEWVWKFWEWNTTFEWERYTILITEDGGKAVSVNLHSDLFASDKWQYFTCAASPDLTEFWSPSPADGVREPILAKQVSINQALQNSQEINDPVTYFDVGAVHDPDLMIQYMKARKVPMKEGTDINKAVQTRQIPSIQTPFAVYDKLDQIVAVASGVTNDARGASTEDKVGIYEGNVKEAADRFAVVGDLKAYAQRRFATLYLEWLDEHLTKPMAIDIIGADWVAYKQDVSNKDLKRQYDFDITIVTSGQEQAMQGVEKRNKLTFLTNNKINPLLNAQKVIESEAIIAGFNQDEVKELLAKDYGESELMSEAAQDIQTLLTKKKIRPNKAANIAYAQKILDFATDESENLKPEQFDRFIAYIDELKPIIVYNMSNSINDQLAKEWLISVQGQAMGMSGQAQVPWTTEVPQAGTQIADAMPQGIAIPQEQLQY